MLRLAIQVICKELGEKGKNINDDIANLVKKGLSVQIQQSLDVIRVVGNNAVHPGQIDIDEDETLISTLFEILNFIVNQMITQPKKINDLYAQLPQNVRDSIEKRDEIK